MSNFVELNKNKIQQLRETQCWSQEQLASASGLSIRTIQRVEKTGNASLETVKALASVFNLQPDSLKPQKDIQYRTFHAVLNYGWLVMFAMACVLFGLWVIDILIPTLKGADFNAQYELHGNFRYLDFGSASFIIGFIWLGVNLSVQHIQTKKMRQFSQMNAKT